MTRAAERLFVSQPALSKQLGVLERLLGFRVFERVPAGVVLTRQGAALLPVARELLERWNAGVEQARAAAPTGTLVIGLQTAVGRGLQQEAMRRFRAAMPGWEVSLRLVGWDDPSSGLRTGPDHITTTHLLPVYVSTQPCLPQKTARRLQPPMQRDSAPTPL
ncbi:hypothetical protein GCM10020220_013840 [Nonomuraea rubra]